MNVVKFDSNAFASKDEQICYSDFDLSKNEKVLISEIADPFGLHFDKKSGLLMLQFEKEVHVYAVNVSDCTAKLVQKF